MTREQDPGAGHVFLPARRPGPRPFDGEQVKTTCRVLGRAQVDTFLAMCALRGRRPHELVADIVLAAIREGQEDHDTQALVQALRRSRSGLRLVYGGPGSRMGRHEMLRAAGGDDE